MIAVVNVEKLFLPYINSRLNALIASHRLNESSSIVSTALRISSALWQSTFLGYNLLYHFGKSRHATALLRLSGETLKYSNGVCPKAELQ